MLAAGVGRVVIGSAAVTQVETVRGWFDEFGAERIVLAFDVRIGRTRGTPRVATHGWREQSDAVAVGGGGAASSTTACGTCSAPTSAATAR